MTPKSGSFTYDPPARALALLGRREVPTGVLVYKRRAFAQTDRYQVPSSRRFLAAQGYTLLWVLVDGEGEPRWIAAERLCRPDGTLVLTNAQTLGSAKSLDLWLTRGIARAS